MAYDVINMKTIAKQLNNLTYTDYYYRLQLLARSVFQWDNLPNGIDEKWIERYLYNQGSCIFFKDPEKGFMIARYTQAGNVNYYDEPTTVSPVATNYTGDQLENNIDCVIIRNNDMMLPTDPTMRLYSMRLAEISRTIDVNINAQKTPVVVLCSDRQKLSMKRAFSQTADNELVIYGDKDLNLDSIKALKVDAPIVFDKLQIQKHAVWNEAMTFLGINNANQDKRERLVDDEVQANNQQVEQSAQVMLKAREQACKQINEIFKLNPPVSVKLRTIDKPILDNWKEGEE